MKVKVHSGVRKKRCVPRAPPNHNEHALSQTHEHVPSRRVRVAVRVAPHASTPATVASVQWWAARQPMASGSGLTTLLNGSESSATRTVPRCPEFAKGGGREGTSTHEVWGRGLREPMIFEKNLRNRTKPQHDKSRSLCACLSGHTGARRGGSSSRRDPAPHQALSRWGGQYGGVLASGCPAYFKRMQVSRRPASASTRRKTPAIQIKPTNAHCVKIVRAHQSRHRQARAHRAHASAPLPGTQGLCRGALTRDCRIWTCVY